jgi:E3 ubiquitin-protein ligase DOA10
VDHTLRLIQHNWVVLACNFNIVILVLIIGESSISAISAYHFVSVLSLLLPCSIILFLHLLSTNHKCTQPCYFPLLLKPAAQKEKMVQNSSMRSSRLRVNQEPFLWSYGVFHRSVSLRVDIVFRDITYVIIILSS